MVIVGRVKGAWGLRGDLKVEALTDNPNRLSPNSTLYLEGRPVQVERSRGVKGGVLLKLQLVNDRSQADLLRDKYLTVPEQDTEPLPEGTYYHFQLLDMAVFTDEEEHLGELGEIISTGGNDVYVVKDGDAEELLIPSLKEVILRVDVPGNRMTVRLPEGLR